MPSAIRGLVPKLSSCPAPPGLPPVSAAPRRARRERAAFASIPAAALAAALAVGLTLAPAPARAADTAAADALFSEAKELVAKKMYAEACPKFEASYKLDRAVGTLMNLADCHENTGRIATAWAEWGEAFEWLKREGDKRSEFATSRRDALAPRLPKLTITVTRPASRLAVFRDATRIEEGAYNVALPTDPGPHAITVRRGDEVLKEERVELAEGAALSVTLDLAAIERAAPPPKPGGGDAVTGPAPRSAQKTIGFIVGGVGLASIAVAGVLEAVALSHMTTARADDGCLNKLCSPRGYDAVQTAGSFADAGQWVFVGGLLVTGVGLTMVLTAPAPPPSPSMSPSSPSELPDTRSRRASPSFAAALVPYVGPSGAGISIAGQM
jgi:hypothetical protein